MSTRGREGTRTGYLVTDLGSSGKFMASEVDFAERALADQSPECVIAD